MNEITIKTKIVHVEPFAIKIKWTYVIGEPYYDISESAAKALGTTRRKWRKMMNGRKH
jgi:hypothetical protein